MLLSFSEYRKARLFLLEMVENKKSRSEMLTEANILIGEKHKQHLNAVLNTDSELKNKVGIF